MLVGFCRGRPSEVNPTMRNCVDVDVDVDAGWGCAVPATSQRRQRHVGYRSKGEPDGVEVLHKPR